MEEATQNLAALASLAGGKPDGSWKAALSDDSSWEDVLREAPFVFYIYMVWEQFLAKPLLYMLSVCYLYAISTFLSVFCLL